MWGTQPAQVQASQAVGARRLSARCVRHPRLIANVSGVWLKYSRSDFTSLKVKIRMYIFIDGWIKNNLNSTCLTFNQVSKQSLDVAALMQTVCSVCVCGLYGF